MSSKLTRRSFIALTAGLTGTALISACKPAATPTPSQSAATQAPEPTSAEVEATQPPAPTAQPAAPALKGSLTCLIHGGGSEGPYWKPRLDMFRDEHPDIEFIPLDSDDDYYFVQKMSTMVAGGTPPEMARVSGGRMLATAPMGIYEDLKPRVDASELISSIWKLLPGEGKELTYCGQQIGVPQDLAFSLWFYNKDIFDNAGIPYPTLDWTWDDMVEIGLAVTKPDENQWFDMPGIVSFEDASLWYWQAGGTLFAADCSAVNLSEEPNLVAMEFLVDLFKKHQVCPSPSLNLGEVGVSFDSGKLAMTRSGSAGLSAQLNQPTWNFEWGDVHEPAGPGGSWGFVKTHGWSILLNTKYPDVAWYFIEWWHKEETATAFAKMGEMVPRADIRETVSMEAIPEDLHPAIKRVATNGRGLERCPAWSAAQKFWREELAAAVTGDVPVREAMAAADEKAEIELAQIMADACK